MKDDELAAYIGVDSPFKCDRCESPTMTRGLCQECRLSDTEKGLRSLQETIREYMPVAIPKGKHKLTKVFINGLGGVPVWVSVVVAQPVLVVPPDKFHEVMEFQDSGFNLPVQIIKDEYQAVGGAARSVGKPPMGPVEEFIRECEGSDEPRSGPEHELSERDIV